MQSLFWKPGKWDNRDVAICSSWPQGQKSFVTVQFPYTDVSAYVQIKVFCVGLEIKILWGFFPPPPPFFLCGFFFPLFLLNQVQYFISYYFLHFSQTLFLETLYEKQNYYYFPTTEMDLPSTWSTCICLFKLHWIGNGKERGWGKKKN